ncbi:bifunctional demethylmenaquinone methyltransferase/2-methoxy-6-polyprenyl-1,4-benzoquinol methylase [Phormidium willei BDU 130791]|nr:bifunctional demethylmenaquinone methyltransferase/2-methoxy-6-polyprenyl-1,4-benzoquinol methylase [Phormidium willei BDU 130791]
MADPETPDADQPDSTVSFGYREVPRADKASLVRGVFESVAGRYDLMNDLMSLGVHRLWKDAFVDQLKPRPGLRLLDVAGGTGDIALRVAERLEGPEGLDGEIFVLDLTEGMLRQGRDRALDGGRVGGRRGGLHWICGDAMALPLPARSLDAYTIAFGLRNVTDLDQALAEARRVLRPGGRFLCLEFSRVVLPLLDRAYDLYSFQVLPRLGGLVTGDRDSYQYLVESIRRFPPQAELAARLEAAGFARPSWRNLSGGIAAIHSGWRI